MNRYILLSVTSLLIMVSALYAAPLTTLILPKEQLQEGIKTTLADAFGADHLYAKPVNPQKLEEWEDLIDDAKAYVFRYSHNNSVMMELYRDIKRVNNDLIKAINNTYDILHNARALSPYDRSVFNRNDTSVGSSKRIFGSLEKDAMAAQDKLKSLNININEPWLIKARDMLILLALSIELVAKKAAEDINKEL